MMVEVIMPKLGMYESDVTLIDWLVDDGSIVNVGDPLFIMETDKVETEIECEDDGILVIGATAGHVGPVGSLIGYIVTSADERDGARTRLGLA